MIVVRRIDLNRLPQYSRPMPNTTAMAMAASVISIVSNPRIRTWSGKSGFGCENWNSDWLNHNPMLALRAIHVGARSSTCEERTSARYRPNPTCGDATASASPAGSLTPRQ